MAMAFWSLGCACLLTAAAMPRRPPRLYVKEVASRPAISEAEAAVWGIQDGFEGGRFLKTPDGLYHCFPSERMRRGTGQGNGTLPSDMLMQIGHWVSVSARPGSWYRVGTLVRSTGAFNASTVHSSTWAGMPVYDDDSKMWHLFYVGYRGAPMNGSHAYVQFGGVIIHATSTIPGIGGLGGPYQEVGVILNESMPGTNLSWEGDQGDDAFFPFRLRNGSWLGFFGSALSAKKGGWNRDWHVGLAAGSLGHWRKLPGNPLAFDGAVENPVVTMTQDREYYMAVYYPFTPGMVGFTWSKDGITWSKGVHLNVTPSLHKPCGGNPVTALGLVAEPQLGPGTYSLLFTGRAGGPNDFENVCVALVEDLEAPTPIFNLTYFEDVLYPRWFESFRVSGYAFAYTAKGSCKSPSNATILCPASMYGTADVAYAHFAVGLLDELDAASKEAWAAELQGFQGGAGRFAAQPGPRALQPWHALAEATEALFLLGSRPLRPMEDLATLANRSAMDRFLRENVLLATDGWLNSANVQAPVGILRMLRLEGFEEAVDEWFQELDKLADPGTGLWFTLKDDPRNPRNGAFEHLPSANALFSSFHMLHVYECFGHPWPYPKRLVDSALQLQDSAGFWGQGTSSCADLDGIYIAVRASLQSEGYRWSDVREMCRKYLEGASSFLNDEAWIFGTYTKQEGTHLLHGPLFAVAECQMHFPELGITTRRPWRRKAGACVYA